MLNLHTRTIGKITTYNATTVYPSMFPEYITYANDVHHVMSS